MGDGGRVEGGGLVNYSERASPVRTQLPSTYQPWKWGSATPDVGALDVEMVVFALQKETAPLGGELGADLVGVTGVDIAGVDQLGSVDAQLGLVAEGDALAD